MFIESLVYGMAMFGDFFIMLLTIVYISLYMLVILPLKEKAIKYNIFVSVLIDLASDALERVAIIFLCFAIFFVQFEITNDLLPAGHEMFDILVTFFLWSTLILGTSALIPYLGDYVSSFNSARMLLIGAPVYKTVVPWMFGFFNETSLIELMLKPIFQSIGFLIIGALMEIASVMLLQAHADSKEVYDEEALKKNVAIVRAICGIASLLMFIAYTNFYMVA